MELHEACSPHIPPFLVDESRDELHQEEFLYGSLRRNDTRVNEGSVLKVVARCALSVRSTGVGTRKGLVGVQDRLVIRVRLAKESRVRPRGN